VIAWVATQAGISPLRLGFTGTLKVIPRAIPDFQDIQPEQLLYTKLIREILAEKGTFVRRLA